MARSYQESKSSDPIRPNRFYVWTWIPKNYLSKADKYFYPKHLTGIPYFTKEQIALTYKLTFGTHVLKKIRVIRGRELIQQGVYTPWDVNPNGGHSRFWYKGELIPAPRIYLPIECKNLYHTRELLYKAYKKHRRNGFNRLYKKILAGQRVGISPYFQRKKRRQISNVILQNLSKVDGKSQKELLKFIFKELPYFRKFSSVV